MATQSKTNMFTKKKMYRQVTREIVNKERLRESESLGKDKYICK